MATVWVIEEGEYSDYHVEGIFSSKERAEEAIASGACEGRINERELDPATPRLKLIEEGWRLHYIQFDKDGNVIQHVEVEDKHDLYRNAKRPDEPRWLIDRVRKYAFIPWDILIRVWAKTKEQAVKVAAEKRRAVLAGSIILTPTAGGIYGRAHGEKFDAS